jgi:hypothetical protein
MTTRWRRFPLLARLSALTRADFRACGGLSQQEAVTPVPLDENGIARPVLTAA